MKPAVDRYSIRPRKRPDLSLSKVRSAISNGSTLFSGDIDERGAWVRRFRDLLHSHASDLGGKGLSEGQKALVRRCAMIELQLEMMESRFAVNEGVATPRQLERYQRVSNTLRRLIETLGLHQGRVARNVNGSQIDATARIVEEIRERYAG